jgi:UDP-N-acetylglucosamine 2-epimerase (non-hydrolysing)
LRGTCEAIRQLACLFPDLEFVLPVHPNPEVKGPVEELLGDLPIMHLIEPVDYLEFVHLMNRATIILTDSGGIQEEAPSLGKPVLVVRDATDRPEGIAAGVARLVGTDPGTLVDECRALLDGGEHYRRMIRPVSPYGDGRAAPRVVRAVMTTLAEDAEDNRRARDASAVPPSSSIVPSSVREALTVPLRIPVGVRPERRPALAG